MRWANSCIPGQVGRTVVVTGSSSGIGFETAKTLAQKGAQVVLACRDSARARGAVARIRSETESARAEAMQLDLASLRSIHSFASAFNAKYKRLDLLVNNAGVMLVPAGRTEDGFERHMGINHLGHFTLTGLILDRLLAAPEGRIVMVSSLAQRLGRIEMGDPMGEERRYSAFAAYARSKLANLLFAYELQRRLRGSRAIVVAAHPGIVATDLGRRMSERSVYRFCLPLFEWLSQSPAQGARAVLRAATDPCAAGGAYYGPGGLFEMWGDPVIVPSGQAAQDPELASKLWEVSEALTGVSFLPAHPAAGPTVKPWDGQNGDDSAARTT